MRSWGNPCAMSQCISTTVHLWGQNVWWKNQLLPTSSLQGNNLIPFLGRNRVGMRLVLTHTYWNTSTICATNNGYRLRYSYSGHSCDCTLKVSIQVYHMGPHMINKVSSISHSTHNPHDFHSQHSQHWSTVVTVDFVSCSYMYLSNVYYWWQLGPILYFEGEAQMKLYNMCHSWYM